ncbi:hypothetical protein B0T13DRAFT_246755 [Neurospora crassa]|nr:hypothetical protein B0T13DRAFT_246755 [Neurospora crassa]
MPRATRSFVKRKDGKGAFHGLAWYCIRPSSYTIPLPGSLVTHSPRVHKLLLISRPRGFKCCASRRATEFWCVFCWWHLDAAKFFFYSPVPSNTTSQGRASRIHHRYPGLRDTLFLFMVTSALTIRLIIVRTPHHFGPWSLVFNPPCIGLVSWIDKKAGSKFGNYGSNNKNHLPLTTATSEQHQALVTTVSIVFSTRLEQILQPPPLLDAHSDFSLTHPSRAWAGEQFHYRPGAPASFFIVFRR